MWARRVEALQEHFALRRMGVSFAAWQALWPAARQRQWALYRFGAQILCDLDAHDTRRFFDAFFKIDSSLWTGFMSATLSPLGLARAMAAVFSAASLF